MVVAAISTLFNSLSLGTVPIGGSWTNLGFQITANYVLNAFSGAVQVFLLN